MQRCNNSCEPLGRGRRRPMRKLLQRGALRPVRVLTNKGDGKAFTSRSVRRHGIPGVGSCWRGGRSGRHRDEHMPNGQGMEVEMNTTRSARKPLARIHYECHHEEASEWHDRRQTSSRSNRVDEPAVPPKFTFSLRCALAPLHKSQSREWLRSDRAPQ